MNHSPYDIFILINSKKMVASKFRDYPWRVHCFSKGAMTLSVILSFSMPMGGLFMGSDIFTTNFGFNLFSIYVFYELFNIMGNWYLFLKQRSLVKKFYVPATEEDLQDMRPVGIGSGRMHYACHICKCISYQGTHHCGMCGQCIPQRDHHCFFLGSCVGEHNMRYFSAFCLHVGISCMVFVTIGILYGNITYKELLSRDFLYYFVPFALGKFVVREINFWHFVLVMLIYLSFSTGAVALIYSLSILYKVTMAQLFPNRKQEDDSLTKQVIPSLGPGWKLGLLIPMPYNMKRLDQLRLSKLV